MSLRLRMRNWLGSVRSWNRPLMKPSGRDSKKGKTLKISSELRYKVLKTNIKKSCVASKRDTTRIRSSYSKNYKKLSRMQKSSRASSKLTN